MMEVTPHLKSVLKTYQHSATKSLQGPGLSLVATSSGLSNNNKGTSPSPELKEEEFVVPTPCPIQQLPILTVPDTSCSERTDTVLEGESISCFVVGGERRLCLPQVLNSVLRDFSLHQINQECDQLQIYCSRCTPEQLNVLKDHGILPNVAPSSGLITKTDAERLCSALLHGQIVQEVKPRKGAASFGVYHKCFGKCRGVCFPELYVAKAARCIVCSECSGGFSPQQFVCHVHKHYAENRTVHWGFDSANWRVYLRVCKDQGQDHERFVKCLDEMKEQYDGSAPFPLPQYSGIKRKQVLTSDLIKDHDLPLKKQKIVGDYLGGVPIPCIYPIDPVYLQYVQQVRLQAFKPVSQQIKETKMYHQMLDMGLNRYAAGGAAAVGGGATSNGNVNREVVLDQPPLLQDPKRVVLSSDSERFESSFQPNVALAPHVPKKQHRYGKFPNHHHINNNITNNNKEIKVESHDADVKVIVKQEILDEVSVIKVEPPPVAPIIPRYNSEIELSTDTEDSASESTATVTNDCKDTRTAKDNNDLIQIEDCVRNGVDLKAKERILDMFRDLIKERERLVVECRAKDERIKELEVKLAHIDKNDPVALITNGIIVKEESCSSSIIKKSDSCEVTDQVDEKSSDDDELKSIEGQPSVIASLEEAAEPKAIIINTAPE